MLRAVPVRFGRRGLIESSNSASSSSLSVPACELAEAGGRGAESAGAPPEAGGVLRCPFGRGVSLGFSLLPSRRPGRGAAVLLGATPGGFVVRVGRPLWSLLLLPPPPPPPLSVSLLPCQLEEESPDCDFLLPALRRLLPVGFDEPAAFAFPGDPDGAFRMAIASNSCSRSWKHVLLMPPNSGCTNGGKRICQSLHTAFHTFPATQSRNETHVVTFRSAWGRGCFSAAMPKARLLLRSASSC